MHHLDELDVKIIKELGNPNSFQWNVRESYSNIAERIGVDDETVRRRVKQYERQGSVPGWKMMINPYLIGCRAANIHCEVEDQRRKPDVITELKELDGMVKILNFHGSGLLLTLYFHNAETLKDRVHSIASVTDCPDPKVWELAFPESYIRTRNTDWRIIGAMVEDARRSLKVISEAVGLSVRTVEKRLNELSESYALYLQGTPNFRKFAGLSCVFMVFCQDEKEKRAVDHTILSRVRRIELATTGSEHYSTFVTLFENLGQADDFIGWINDLNGVESVSMGIMKELFVVTEWMEDEIIKRQRAK